MDFNYKYIKYKNKYLKQKGGDSTLEKTPAYILGTKYLTTTSLQSELNYFFLQKLTETNINFWKTYALNRTTATARSHISYNDGIISFQMVLSMLYRAEFEIYIAYVTRKQPLDTSIQDFDIRESDIEMCFGVLIDKNIPITTHMGIFRNSEYTNPHKNISMELHTFAMAACNLLYPNKLYMITKPVVTMRTIAINYFQKTNLPNLIWVGSRKERLKCQKLNTMYNNIKQLLESNDPNLLEKSAPLFTYFYENPAKITSSQKILAAKINILNERINTILSYSTPPEFYNKIESDINFLTDTMIDINIPRPIIEWRINQYDLSTKNLDEIITYNNRTIILNQIKTYYTQYINTFIPRRIKQLLSTLSQQEPCNVPFIPEDYTESVPFNDLDNTNWYVTYDNTTTQFNKPKWFDHPHLRNFIPFMIFNIQAISKLW